MCLGCQLLSVTTATASEVVPIWEEGSQRTPRFTAYAARSAIDQAFLTALRTEALRQRGSIARAVQLQRIASTVWESVKQGTAAMEAGINLRCFLNGDEPGMQAS